MITSLEELHLVLRDFSIEEYLLSRGVSVQNRKLLCLNPEHEDHDPSMVIHRNAKGEYVRCYSCNYLSDIISLHADFLKLDSTGSDFVTAMLDLADFLKIPYLIDKTGIASFNEDFKIKQDYYHVFEIMFNCIEAIDSSIPEHSAIYDHLKFRNWETKIDSLRELGIGYLNINKKQKIGDEILSIVAYTKKYFPDLDFDLDSFMWQDPSRKMVTTYFDLKGRPVGFSNRNLDFESRAKSQKWINTSLNIPIFRKSSLLYLGNIAKKNLQDKTGKKKVIVFEGQPSAVTAKLNNVNFTVAITGSSVSQDQIQSLKSMGADQYILCFDPDNAGKKATRECIEHYATVLGGNKLFVKDLGSKDLANQLDPDEFIREKGIESFMKVKEVPSFDWLLTFLKDNSEDINNVVRQLISFIATFPSPLDREDLAKRLSKLVDYSLDTIMAEISGIVDYKELNQNQKIRETTDHYAAAIKRDPNQADLLIEKMKIEIDALKVRPTGNGSGTGDFYVNILDNFKETSFEFAEAFPGFNMPLMPSLQEAFNNDWSKGKLFVVGGEENAGKSSFSSFLAYNLALPEAENNLRVLYMTIDDSVPELLPKFVAIAGRHQTFGYRNYEKGFPLEINHVVRPNYWAKRLRDLDPQLEKDMLYAYQVGYNFIRQLAKEERLILFGIPDSVDLDDFVKTTAKYRKKYPQSNIYSYLDNIHKLPLPQGDARLGFKDISNRLKLESVRLESVFGGTLEYNSDGTKRQKDQRPTNNSLAESRSFRYDASAIVHMYNHQHIFGEASPWYHEVRDLATPALIRKWPVVEGIIGKNKISGDKTVHAFRFHPSGSWFEEVNLQDEIAIIKARENGDSGSSSSPGEKSFSDMWEIDED